MEPSFLLSQFEIDSWVPHRSPKFQGPLRGVGSALSTFVPELGGFSLHEVPPAMFFFFPFGKKRFPFREVSLRIG